MGEWLISTVNVAKSFGRTDALKGLNLQVPKGIAGFIGKNGSGKTTTIGVLLGLLKPNCGKAFVFGLDCWKESFEIRCKLGIMHENSAYPTSFTGKRFLEYVAKIYGVTQVKQQVKRALKDVGLKNKEDEPIKAYSAGMIRRLGLAQALIGNPELAILDEPTANIDPSGRITILETIKEIHKEQGTSFLISTHILSDLEKICDWLSIIDSGSIVDQGYVRDLAAKYSGNIYRINTSDPYLLASKIRDLKAVDLVWIENDTIYCKVKDPNMFCRDVPRIATELKLQLQSLQQMLGTLEEIYKATAGSR